MISVRTEPSCENGAEYVHVMGLTVEASVDANDCASS